MLESIKGINDSVNDSDIKMELWKIILIEKEGFDGRQKQLNPSVLKSGKNTRKFH